MSTSEPKFMSTMADNDNFDVDTSFSSPSVCLNYEAYQFEPYQFEREDEVNSEIQAKIARIQAHHTMVSLQDCLPLIW